MIIWIDWRVYNMSNRIDHMNIIMFNKWISLIYKMVYLINIFPLWNNKIGIVNSILALK